VEGRTLTVAQAIKESLPYLIGKDSFRVVHHWQSMDNHAFNAAAPFSPAPSPVWSTLWDLTGKALGVPVHKLRVSARCGGQTDQEAADLVCVWRKELPGWWLSMWCGWYVSLGSPRSWTWLC
jgi:L-alanine-DL-glutamate epimerase-like enolase superfamily enzyme